AGRSRFSVPMRRPGGSVSMLRAPVTMFPGGAGCSKVQVRTAMLPQGQEDGFGGTEKGVVSYTKVCRSHIRNDLCSMAPIGQEFSPTQQNKPLSVAVG